MLELFRIGEHGEVCCAGAAYDLTKDTARSSQSRAELDRKYRKTGSAVVSRAEVNKVLDSVCCPSTRFCDIITTVISVIIALLTCRAGN